ncbi:hypothetical protein [Spiroplasma endosymbiont of Virgichneumon dumeticola]|uniref:hypothetical protein n=1 Tax=Spiroplasma endosymbiont of Virgichneumon dumeticola TaxID=3139323 RepID=UPI0035C90E1D
MFHMSYYHLFLSTNRNFENQKIIDNPPTYQEVLEQDKKTLPTYEETTDGLENGIDAFDYFKDEINYFDLQNQNSANEYKSKLSKI